GVDLNVINPILDELIGMYEKDYKTAPAGKIFDDCYDLVTLTPSDEYVKVYDEAAAIMEKLGLKLGK
ncbi:monomethylamine:corrinoid methyltransferase, partial [Dehalobacterium formicoaceticum]